MTRKKNVISQAFLAAPARIDLNIIKEELEGRGINPITAYDIPSLGLSILDNIEKAIRDSDLFVAVIPEDYSPNVFFELGLAHALRKRFLLVVSPKLKEIPSDIAGKMYLRSEPNNREAIAFALDQLLASQVQKTFRHRKQHEEGHPLGDVADMYLRRLQEKGSSLKGRELEEIVAEILRASGISTVTQSTERDLGVDLAVWSDDLQTIVGNPFLIEVKSGVRTRKDLERALYQVEKYRMQSGTKWALLLLSTTVATIPVVGGVLALTLAELLERLRTRTFAEVIRELRNKQVHGGLT